MATRDLVVEASAALAVPIEEGVHVSRMGADLLDRIALCLILPDNENLRLRGVGKFGHPRPRVLVIERTRKLLHYFFEVAHKVLLQKSLQAAMRGFATVVSVTQGVP